MYSGLTRPIDRLGRVVIPMELRKKYNLMEGDVLEFGLQGNEITLRKYYPYEEISTFLDDVSIHLNVVAMQCNLSNEEFTEIENKISEVKCLFDKAIY